MYIYVSFANIWKTHYPIGLGDCFANVFVRVKMEMAQYYHVLYDTHVYMRKDAKRNVEHARGARSKYSGL